MSHERDRCALPPGINLNGRSPPGPSRGMGHISSLLFCARVTCWPATQAPTGEQVAASQNVTAKTRQVLFSNSITLNQATAKVLGNNVLRPRKNTIKLLLTVRKLLSVTEGTRRALRCTFCRGWGTPLRNLNLALEEASSIPAALIERSWRNNWIRQLQELKYSIAATRLVAGQRRPRTYVRPVLAWVVK